MQMASSAKRTWSELRSASLYTATAFTPRSLQAQMTRKAISPRFAINIFLNIIYVASLQTASAALFRHRVAKRLCSGLGATPVLRFLVASLQTASAFFSDIELSCALWQRARRDSGL